MKNYERYHKLDHTTYGRPGISDYFMKIPGNRVILPVLGAIADKTILEIGPGTGEYTRRFLDQRCRVTGVDINPHLGKELDITIRQGEARSFSALFPGEEFEVTASFWMTEYLAPEELAAYFCESYKVLEAKGRFLTTVIANRGWGRLYVTAARIKGVKKFAYPAGEIEKLLGRAGFSAVTITPIIGRLGLIFAYFVSCTR